ncbi:prophage P3 protein 0 [Lactiplantibacillus plantarum WCFS1]|uniref:Prophage P3 protein 0 n=1 Tax=Lactiplantibacillus plantarum (strain ATCC BAA-793 / NCIMB 8826 / WCFS1) TaxID=220668 RepID=F9UU74_LACPL|nr:prophage P3 protein 0 [Lactiplantibacillus plantarum WCFS1]
MVHFWCNCGAFYLCPIVSYYTQKLIKRCYTGYFESHCGSLSVAIQSYLTKLVNCTKLKFALK